MTEKFLFSHKLCVQSTSSILFTLISSDLSPAMLTCSQLIQQHYCILWKLHFNIRWDISGIKCVVKLIFTDGKISLVRPT